MTRGHLFWAALPHPIGTRPVVIVTRSRAVALRSRVTVALITRTVFRGRFVVPVGPHEGLRERSFINCDELITIPKELLLGRIGSLRPERMAALNSALAYALGL